MVSTRGIKYKFAEGEKVLCYEPDPAKAKVLYNSKVLEIIDSKDESGKKFVEFLIHFQGWNSTWDRFVTEEYVLKDTEENRQLQKELAEKAQLTSGGNLYKRDRKKRKRKLSESASDSLDSKQTNESLASEPEAESDFEASSLSDSSSSVDDGLEPIPIELSETMKKILEEDYKFVNQENKLSKLPCSPNVVTILEKFVKHWALKQLCPTNEKFHRNHTSSQTVINLESISRKLNLCKEVADGIRIYFDFNFGPLLLYKEEREQFTSAISLPANAHLKSDNDEVKQKGMDGDSHEETEIETEGGRKKSLRSHRISLGYEHINGIIPGIQNPFNHNLRITPSSGIPGTSSGPVNQNSPKHKALLNHIHSWKMVPQSLYSQEPAPPSLIYGAIHVARLFVKFPELLQPVNMPEEKLAVVLEYFGQFLKYLEDHREWFGIDHYEDNPIPPSGVGEI